MEELSRSVCVPIQDRKRDGRTSENAESAFQGERLSNGSHPHKTSAAQRGEEGFRAVKHLLKAQRFVNFHDKIGEKRQTCVFWCSAATGSLCECVSATTTTQTTSQMGSDGGPASKRKSDDKQDGPTAVPDLRRASLENSLFETRTSLQHVNNKSHQGLNQQSEAPEEADVGESQLLGCGTQQ